MFFPSQQPTRQHEIAEIKAPFTRFRFRANIRVRPMPPLWERVTRMFPGLTPSTKARTAAFWTEPRNPLQWAHDSRDFCF
jgi:hypothetical protein